MIRVGFLIRRGEETREFYENFTAVPRKGDEIVVDLESHEDGRTFQAVARVTKVVWYIDPLDDAPVEPEVQAELIPPDDTVDPTDARA